MAEERRENLKLLYKNYHKENWARGNSVWVVNSILITGSLLIAFQSTFQNHPIALVSLALVLLADFLQTTNDEITSITYNTMREIEKKLGLSKLGNLAPRMMYNSKIKEKSWYPIRILSTYFLYSWLAGLYLLLVYNELWLSTSVFVSMTLIHAYLKLRSLKNSNKSKVANLVEEQTMMSEDRWIAKPEDINYDELEKARTTLLNSYNSYVQNHAGYALAIMLGFFALFSSLDTFLTSIELTVFFIFLNMVLTALLFYTILRTIYWTSLTNYVLILTLNKVVSNFNKHHQKLGVVFTEKASIIVILTYAVKRELEDADDLPWHKKLALKTS